MVKCSCSASSPCKTKQSSCASARVACSLMCSCHGDADICGNEITKGQSEEDDGSDDGESYSMSINDAIVLFVFVETISDFLQHFSKAVILCIKRLHCFKYTELARTLRDLQPLSFYEKKKYFI